MENFPSKVKDTDVHCMNKRALQRNTDLILELQMNRGFLIQAQTEDERPQAMALAYSIKISIKMHKLIPVCGELGEIEDWHEEPPDTIVEYPF